MGEEGVWKGSKRDGTFFDLVILGCCGPHLESWRVISRIGERPLSAGRKSTYYERLDQNMIADEPYEHDDYDILHNNARLSENKKIKVMRVSIQCKYSGNKTI